MSQSRPSPPPQLYLFEWFVIISIASILFTIGLISYLSLDSQEGEFLTSIHQLTKPEPLVVTVSGAIEISGEHLMQKGDDFSALCQKMKPLPDANLSRFKGASKLRKNQNFFIPSTCSIWVYLEGAVRKPGLHELPRGITYKELKKLDLFTQDADLRPLNKKRKLKDLEIIKIGEGI